MGSELKPEWVALVEKLGHGVPSDPLEALRLNRLLSAAYDLGREGLNPYAPRPEYPHEHATLIGARLAAADGPLIDCPVCRAVDAYRRSEPRGDDRGSGLRPLALASGGNRDPGPSWAAGAWVTVPREPTAAMREAAVMADVPWEFVETRNGNRVVGPFALELSGPDKLTRAAKVAAALYRAMIASAPKAEVEGWLDIASAPRDGTHVLGLRTDQTFGHLNGQQLPEVQTVIHWFDGDFYTSVNELEPERPFPAAYWKPLTSLEEAR